MILGDTNDRTSIAPFARWPTLDDLFCAAVRRGGDAEALVDPPNRFDFTGATPKCLSFASADRIVSAIAERLRGFGLATDSIVALQLPNTVESVLTLLGIWRAGLIAAPLPLLWRRAETVEALARIGARGFITCRKIGSTDYGEIAAHVAADVFSIRCVGSFGLDPPDGFERLDDVFYADPLEVPAARRAEDPANHLAIVTFDMTEDGLVPVARSHAQLLAGGLAVALEGRVRPESHILGAIATSSFAGFATTIALWLITGGRLTLHQPFDAEILAKQCAASPGNVTVLPGPVLARLSEAGLFAVNGGQKALAVWRAPERRAAAAGWWGPADVIDVLAFGEVGLVPARRTIPGEPAPLVEQALTLPIAQEAAHVLIEVERIAGMLALSGAMVPRHAFPPGADVGPHAGPTGFVDTAYACRVGPDGTLLLDGPPQGIVNVGGYRFRLKDLNDVIPQTGADGTLAILPHSLTGYRLAGVAGDREAVRDTLVAHGANALVAGAFAPEHGRRASAA